MTDAVQAARPVDEDFFEYRRTRDRQERVPAIGTAVGPLAQRLARSPSPKEIADETGFTEEEVLEALEADGAYGTTSLEPAAETGSSRGDTSMRLADEADERPDQLVERRVLAASLVENLSEREQLIVDLRFNRGMTQS